MQHGRFAAAISALGVLTACSGPTQGDPSAATTDPQAFCEQLSVMNQAGRPEPGGNDADLLTELLAVADASIADDVETFRDYHRDEYREGDPSTDTYDRLPADVREAVDRIDAYAGQHCEDYDPDFS
jgi:hypothetical protein